MTAAERIRNWRARRKEGLRCYRIFGDEVWLEAELQEAGFLKPTLCERSHAEVESGLQAMLDFMRVTRDGEGNSEPLE